MLNLKTLLIVSLVIGGTLSDFTCTSTNPSVSTDCFSQTTNSGNLCCYISGVQVKNTECISIPINSFNGQTNIVQNGNLYSLSCNKNVDKKSILNTCGDGTELSQGDCAKSSSFVNSCCYSEGTVATPAGCYWLGSKFSGTAAWAGLSVSCSATFIGYSLSLLFLILLF